MMFIKIPFESEIDFKSNIREITKMSLEHDYNVNDGVVLGNFYISGEYKTHELSINTEEFKYTLPFTVELRNDINRESLEFNIEDFSYDIVDNSKLKINIEYSLSGDVVDTLDEEDDELFERIPDEEMESDIAYMDEIIDSDIEKEEDNNDEKSEEVFSKSQEEIQEKVEEEKEEEREDKMIEEEIKEVKEEVKNENITDEIIKERLDESDTKTIMDTIKNEDDTFITYHIHIAKESDTFESISTMYKVPVSLINEYNNLETINVGDKILIPFGDE